MAVAALAVAGLAVACGSDEAGGSRSPQNPHEPIRALLRERAQRLNAGDVEGYLRPLSPEARKVEEPIALGVESVPIERVDMTVGSALISSDGSSFSDADVTLVYRYKGLPEDNIFKLRMVYSLRLQGGSWVVDSVRIPEGELLPIWATGPVSVAESPHFLVLSRPDTAGFEEGIEAAERSREALLPRLTLTPDPMHVLVLAADEETYSEVAGAANEVAVASWAFEQSSAYPERPENRMMTANLERLFGTPVITQGQKKWSTVAPLVVFQHELAHLALSRFDRPSTPRWVQEGGAMLLSDERRRDEWRAMIDSGRLSNTTLQGLESSDAGALDYAFCNAAALYLVEKFGSEQFFDFYQNFKEFNERLATPESRSSGAERLLRRYFHFGLEDLNKATRDWIRREVG